MPCSLRPVGSGEAPGIVAMAANSRDILFQGAFGFKDAHQSEAIQSDTIFRIASMTKPITSVAVMQLVEQGRIELDKGIGDYLPELANPKVLEGFDDAGSPRLRAARRAPTIRELLSNTSGYAYGIWNDDIRRFEDAAKLPSGRARFPLLPLASDPGSRWEYSPSTDILGLLIESESGLSLEAYFRENIFQPLGMQDTFFQVPAEKWGRAIPYHVRRPDGGFTLESPLPDEPPQVAFFSGGGGLSSTAPDYIRFVRTLLNGGELDGARILEAETLNEMARNQIGDFEAGEMMSLEPRLSADVHLFPGAKDEFGLGFLINAQPVAGGRSAGSLMWAGLYNTYFWIDRENDVGGVLMTQMLPFADPAILETLERFETAVYASALAKSD